jgi:uncharacterized protein
MGAEGSPAEPKTSKTVRRVKKWGSISAAGLFAILVAAILVISWISGQGLLHPDRELGTGTPSDAGLRWSWANFTTADAVPIVGWWMPADESPEDNVTVFFLHGYGDAKNQSLGAAKFLVPAGYNVLAFDFRACGESGGAYTTAGILEVREVEAALHWLQNQSGFPDDPSLVLFGWSMGGAVALRAAAKIEGVRAVVADGSYSKLQNIVDTSIVHFIKDAIGFSVPRWPIGPLSVQFASWSVGVELDDFPPRAAIGQLTMPILLIQGDNDTTVLPSNVEELAEEGGPNVEVFRVPNAKHVGSLTADPVGYPARVLEFLNRTVVR